MKNRDVLDKQVLKTLYNHYNIYSSGIQKAEYNRRERNYSDKIKPKNISDCTCRYKGKNRIYKLQRYSYTEFGVERIKIVPKKIRRIYLPNLHDVGVGSDSASFIRKKIRHTNENYAQKIVSTKCVGSNKVFEDKKISAVTQTKSNLINFEVKDTPKVISSNIQARKSKVSNIKADASKNTKKNLTRIAQEKAQPNTEVNTIKNKKEIEVSSDSLLQHIYNLENPSDDKCSTSLVDPNENKLEREYRKMFTINQKSPKADEKTNPDIKCPSSLRKRFEALRQGLGWVKDFSKHSLDIKIPSQISVASRRDVSIASDPPSLEARSISKTKVYSPNLSLQEANTTVDNYNKSKESDWSKEIVAQDVKGMFRLWGRKFNLEEDNNAKGVLNEPSTKKEVLNRKDKIQSDGVKDTKKKKESKRFSFFRKKKKDLKSKTMFDDKKVTAGRCEVGDGLPIKSGNSRAPKDKEARTDDIVKENKNNILQKSWLSKFISEPIPARKSVQVRWDNVMYGPSSSTVFDLKDFFIHRNEAFIFTSASDESDDSLLRSSHPKAKVKFMQNIKAWMMPKTIVDHQNVININNRGSKYENIVLTNYNRKFMVKKSKPAPRNIKIVLHSKNLNKSNRDKSSEYILLNIPEGYFSESSDYPKLSTDEEVYNIIEYDTQKSSSAIKQTKSLHVGDNTVDNTKVFDDKNDVPKVSDTSTKSPLLRDVVTQGSKVKIPKPREVIEVGIITQKDLRTIKKPILKIKDYRSDEESEHILHPQKKCEFAESYLQDYYRNCVPYGLNLFSCTSESQFCSSRHNSIDSLKPDGDTSNTPVHDSYGGSTIVSPCDTSSCSQCRALNEDTKADALTKILNKFIKKSSGQAINNDGKRYMPKDSLEVYKRRITYASGNKSKWRDYCDIINPSKGDKFEEKSSSEKRKDIKSCCNRRKSGSTRCKKHVLLPDLETMDEILAEQLCDKVLEGILSFKGSGCEICKKSKEKCPKHAQVNPKPVCEIPQPPCKESCEKIKKPPCSKKNSPTCNVPIEPRCPTEPPICLPKTLPKSSPYQSPNSKEITKSSSCENKLKCNKSTSPCKNTPTKCPRATRSNSQEIKKRRPCCCGHKTSRTNSPPPKSSSSLSRLPRITSPKQTCKSECPSKPTTPPCSRPCKKSPDLCTRKSSEQCHCPQKNQMSNCPSKESGISLKMRSKACSPRDSFGKFINDVKGLFKKTSCPNVEKECRPDCANRKKLPTRECPPTRQDPVQCPPKCRPKLTGVHLKLKPIQKNSSSDNCMNNSNNNLKIIKINSNEKITVKVRKDTPSTEEIRKGYNMKVQDEDGQTLYERRDYRREKNTCNKNMSYVVRDLYKDPNVNRVNTMIDDVSGKRSVQSSSSLSNDFEINLTLNFEQEEQNNDRYRYGDRSKYLQGSQTHLTSSKEIFILQEDRHESTKDKNDLDVKITIKNFKRNSNHQFETKTITNQSKSVCNNDFATKISEKFNSVSTGYSEVLLDEQNYLKLNHSIHASKENVNIVDKNKENSENEKRNAKLCDKISTETVSNTCKKDNTQTIIQEQTSVTYIAVPDTENTGQKSNTTKNIKEISEIKNNVSDSSVSIESIVRRKLVSLLKHLNRREKKEILKQIFETTANFTEKSRKTKIKRVQYLLHAVLTSDSSDYDDVSTHNKLADEFNASMSNASKETDFKSDSAFTISNRQRDSKVQIHPTAETSECSFIIKEECLCSHFADKLNIVEKNCCCCRNEIDKTISCDLNKLSEVETQDSRDVTKKSVIMANVSTTLHIKSDITNPTQKQYCHYLNQNNVIYFSGDKILFLLSNSDVSLKKSSENLQIIDDDILQLNETKKAVLEIYAQKDKGKNTVARLPKFMTYKKYKRTYKKLILDSEKEKKIL